MSGSGMIGSKTGGKGSWRRKAKRQQSGEGLESQKVWAAAQRLTGAHVWQVDNATITFNDSTEALSFTGPELIADARANTYVWKGKAEKKPLADVLADMLSGLNLGAPAAEGNKAEDLGEVPEGIDFSKAEGETKTVD